MHWNADPILLKAGPLSVSWYGLFFATGFLIGFWMMQWMYRRAERNVRELDLLLWFVLAGVIVGMRLVHCLFYEPEYYFSHPLEIPKIWLGGYASHGGAIGLVVAMYLYCRGAGRPKFLWLLDKLAVPAALAGASIRIGNFFNSEIVGTPTNSIFGVVFERFTSDPIHPRHPVQLYESAAYIAIFFVLLMLYLRRPPLRDGTIAGWYFILIFTARFALEFFKTPQATYEAGQVIHVGQYLSLPFIALGLYLLFRARREHAFNEK